MGGRCSSVIGACVVVNRDGWMLTSAHLIGVLQQQTKSAQRVREYEAEVRAMERDKNSKSPHRRTRMRTLRRPGPDTTRNHSVWWGRDGVMAREFKVQPVHDLALSRLEPFDPAWVAHYPVFKNLARGYTPGRSLCRLGFPFHEITPTYDETRNAFVLPPGSVPPPLFPIEGMLTRVVLAPSPAARAAPRANGASEPMPPGKFIETSSPGLRGQSGGPLFDVDGAVWGLQSHTRHHPLGFLPQVPGRAKGQVEHQFLNTGIATHIEPILKLLEENDVAHERGA